MRSHPGAADAKAFRAARSVSVTHSRRFRERTAPSTCVESVRCRPRALSSFCSRHSAKRVSSRCSSAPPANKTAAELAQDRSVEARVGQLQTEQVLPVDAAADRLGRAPVRQVLGKLEQGHKGQPPRAFRRLPAMGEERRELGVGEDRPKLVAQAQKGIASGKGRPGDGCGRSWNLTTHGRVKRHGNPPGLNPSPLQPERRPSSIAPTHS